MLHVDDHRRRVAFATLIVVLVLACGILFYMGLRDADRKDCIAIDGHFPDPVTSEAVPC
jgi:hypothetical protein